MSLPERLSENLYKDGIISDEEREIVQFGLESIGGNLAGVLLTLVEGFLFGSIAEAIIFYVLFFPLRKTAGGFHAKTKVKCLITSAFMLALSFVMFTKYEYPYMIYWICFVFESSLILALAPIDNPSKIFDVKEKKVYRTRSRLVLAGESVMFILALCNSWQIVIRSLSIVYFITCIALVMGYLNMLYFKKN